MELVYFVLLTLELELQYLLGGIVDTLGASSGFKDDILETASMVYSTHLVPLPVLLHNYARAGIICTFLEITCLFP